MLSGLISTYDRRHVRRIDRELSSQGGDSQTVHVQARRLDMLLREHGLDHVDLLTVDVEGGELQVLNSISLPEFSVGVLLVENGYRSWSIPRALRRQGYQLICRISADEVYMREGIGLAS